MVGHMNASTSVPLIIFVPEIFIAPSVDSVTDATGNQELAHAAVAASLVDECPRCQERAPGILPPHSF